MLAELPKSYNMLYQFTSPESSWIASHYLASGWGTIPPFTIFPVIQAGSFGGSSGSGTGPWRPAIVRQLKPPVFLVPFPVGRNLPNQPGDDPQIPQKTMENQLKINGKSMENPWKINRKSTENQWKINGKSTENQWLPEPLLVNDYWGTIGWLYSSNGKSKIGKSMVSL